jgi:hypothetical protein
MMARGFRPVGWVAALGAAALGCYMLSLRVASERADLARLDRKIVAAQQSIRTLQTEVGTRSRIPQLEDWNEEVLALAAPAAGQFVSANVSLARFDMRAPPQPLEPAEIRLASADTAAPAPAARVQQAVAEPAPVAPPQAQVRRASLDIGTPAPADSKARAETPRERARPAAAPIRTAAAPERRREAAPVRNASADERRRPAAAPAATRTAAATERERRRETAPVRTASAQPQRARLAAAIAPSRAAAAARPARTAGARSLLDDRAMRDIAKTSRGERQRGTRD